jgi:hypothetical protein
MPRSRPQDLCYHRGWSDAGALKQEEKNKPAEQAAARGIEGGLP